MRIPLFDVEHISLISPLPPEEAVRRLRAEVAGEGSASSAAPVIGEIGERRFRLRKRLLPPITRNSFQTFLRGRVSPEGAGTRIRCRVGLLPFVAVFMALWFVLLWSGGLFAITMLATGPQPTIALIPLAVISTMTVGAIFMVAWGRRMSKGDGTYLLAFLSRMLEAKEAAAPRLGSVQRTVRR
jgi:hypothetical protein